MPYQRVGDVELYYELHDFTDPWRAGPAPVVLIHGLGGDLRMWLPQVPALCRHFPTITVDLRGHGRSSKPRTPVTVADMALDVVRLLRVLGAERAHFVGLSMGGLIAQQIAVDHPLVVASLVLADTFCTIPPEFQEAMRQALTFIEQHSMDEVARTRITNAFSDNVDAAMRDYFIDQVAQNDKPSYEHAARSTFAFSVADSLGAVSAPTLVVVGDADRVTPPLLSEDIVRRISGARLIRIAGAGHISNLEKPEEFNRAVLEFLSKVDCD